MVISSLQHRCIQTTFLLSSLTAAILTAHQAQAQTRLPATNTIIKNTAYVTFNDVDGSQQTIQSNTVSVDINALYVINLSPTVSQKVEAGSRVIWSTSLTNNSNAPVNVSFESLNQTGLSNIKVYVDSNQNGEFDSDDRLADKDLALSANQQVVLWVVGTANATLSNNQQLSFPLRATIAEDSTVTAQTELAMQVVAPNLVLRQSLDRTNIDPNSTKNFDITYNLEMSNTGSTAIVPTTVTIDGQLQPMILLINPLPPNTEYKSLTVVNPNALVLYRTGDNSYTTKPPANLSTLNEIIVGYPSLASSQAERLSLTVTMNNNTAQTAIKNQFGVQYSNAAGETQFLQSNVVDTQVTGKASIAITSRDFTTPITTSTLGAPLSIKASATMCNADRNALDKVKLRIHSPKTGDIVEVIAIETMPNSGIYEYQLPTEANSKANTNDQILQSVRRDNVDVALINCLDQNEQSTQSIEDVVQTVLIDPYGFVFDAKTGLPVAGATVTLLGSDGKPVGDNVAFKLDLTTGKQISIPAKQITDADGGFIYPLVNVGTYSLKVDTSTIPGNIKYTFTSDKSTYPIASFAEDKLVHESYSYGGKFSLNSGDPALNIDIPIDPQQQVNTQLFVKKAASVDNAEVGDFADYTVTIANRGSNSAETVAMTDTLPRGFIYTVGSMRVNGIKVADPAGGKGPYLKLGVGSLKPNTEIKVQYRVQIGPNALNGDGINRVQAKDEGGQTSNEASAKIDVRPGALIQDGFIIGKVFVDCNKNGIQDNGEQGVPGVRLYLEDGSFIVTDREGKYDFYGISAKTHVLKLDRTTLPAQSKLRLISNRQAGDAGSRFVDLRRGELHRADFAIVDTDDNNSESCNQSLLEQIAERKKKIEQDNISLEQVIRADLTTDPLNYVVSDVRGQPASGCISAEGVSSNCNVELTKTAQNPLSRVSIEPVAAIKTLNLEQTLEEATNNSLQILNLTDGQILPINQATIQIKGMAGAQLQLWVNGQEVPESRIGKKAVLPDSQVAGFDYIGVPLAIGKNQIEVRQLDMMGNIRATRAITVIAPDNLSKISIDSPKQDVAANGSDVYQAVVKVVDQFGTPVSSRTPVTLNSTIGTIQIKDVNPDQTGIQTFIEGGSLLVPIQSPSQPGEGMLEVESGSYHANQRVQFLPDLRPLIVAGIVEGRVNFKTFDPKNLSQVDSRDGFEEELYEIADADDHKQSAHGRVALFLKGKVKGKYLLTLSYDSDKSKGQRLFRDIRPDEYYPVYGDAAAKGFDAQSTSKLYVRVDKGRSYALYGDYATRIEQDEGISLGQYNRSLTGLSVNVENDQNKVTAFAAKTTATQVTNEQRGLGITGPYSLGKVDTDSVLRNSEKVEVIIRDRNNPGLIISRTLLSRFSDYEVDTDSNSIFLKTAIPSVDSDLNPVYLRVTTETDQGGEEYTVAGIAGSHKLNDKVKVGGTYVNSNDPLNKTALASANIVVKLSPTSKFVAEAAHSDRTTNPEDDTTASASGETSGAAYRLELEHSINNTQLRAYHQQADTGFYNTDAVITAGRKESGLKLQSRVDKLGFIKAEAIRTEDTNNGGVRDGVSASIERALNRIIALELGMRYYRETDQPASVTSASATPYSGTTARAKVTAQLPKGSNAFVEYEQDIKESDRKVLALGGNYQLNDKARLYARHELISSLGGNYELNDTQQRNSTVVGIDSKYGKDASVFSEYRVRDGISAREAEAALGLRNRWEINKGVFVNTSLEKVQVLEGEDNTSQDATAASLGVEYLANPNWKATGRLEKRWATQSDNTVSAFGFAYKINDDVTLLTKNIFSQVSSNTKDTGDRTLDRFQLGAAYRDADQNRFDALGKLEYRYENDETELDSPVKREAYIVSTVANYHPDQDWHFSGQYAIKKLNVDFNELESSGIVQLLSGRASYDINHRWDASVSAGVLWGDNSDGKRWLLGGEVGYLLAQNLWLSAGYNFSGYSDKDLIDGDTTSQGPYLRLRFKFDENLFNKKRPIANQLDATDEQIAIK